MIWLDVTVVTTSLHIVTTRTMPYMYVHMVTARMSESGSKKTFDIFVCKVFFSTL